MLPNSEHETKQSRSQSQSDARLFESLRTLAKDSPQSAPDHVYTQLAFALRRRHAKRRAFWMAVTSAVAACLFLALFLAMKWEPRPRIHTTVQDSAHANLVTVEPSPVPVVTAITVANRSHKAHHRLSRPARDVLAKAFVALPSFDPAATSPDDLRIVRLVVPESDLRLVGAPVSEEISERLVTADFVVGHDGTPYAMRLVR